MGIEPGRLHVSWISAAEGTRFAEVAIKVIKTVKDLGPSRYLIKKINAKVA